MKFSIIVVCLNPGEKLNQTLDSILAQSYSDYEIVVKDGRSKDGSIEAMRSDARIRLYVESDKSIYDAMNQAVGHARGEFLLFMNCGDRFYKEDVLERAAEVIGRHPNPDNLVLYGDTYSEKNDVLISSPPAITGFTCYRNIPCHQSCIYTARLCKEKPYNEQYKIRADYDHFLWCCYVAKADMVNLQMTVASYEGGGYSESRENRRRDKEEHKKITAAYMSFGELLKYKLIMLATLAPLRSLLAESQAFSGVYHWVKRRVYGKPYEKSGSRMANMELLRCIAMMMVIVLHYLGKGEILPDLTEAGMDATGLAAWLLESFCIVAVNVYMLISGYFLCTSSFKLSRLIQLYLQAWVYSVGVGLLAVAAGVMPVRELEVHDLLTMVLPVSMGHYWFISAYVFMYVFLPFMGGAVQRLSRKQMQVALGGLLVFFCVLKSVLPVRLELDGQGYDCIWYLCVFLTAAYIRRFGMGIFEKLRNSIILYIGMGLAIFGFTMTLYWFYLRTGSLGRIVKIGLEYNHILPYLAAIGLFGIFLHVRVGEKAGAVLRKIGPCTLGVYLLHENIGLRYAWQNWLGAERIDSVLTLVLWTLMAVAVVFAAGILVELLRQLVMKGLHGLLMKLGCYRKLVGRIETADRLFAVASIRVDIGKDKNGTEGR